MQLPNHGANPKHLTEVLKMPLLENSIDFSVNTTPFPLPTTIIEKWFDYIEGISQYPDPNSEALKQTIALKEKISIDSLLIGNGAAQLIFMIALYFQNKRVAIVEPTFSEYRDACRVFNCQIDEIILQSPWQLDVEKVIQHSKHSDVLFICNPNNPTGVSYSPLQLEYIIEKLQQVTVVIDEAFYDFKADGKTVIQLINKYPNVIVLRSLTKMYGIAGLRLGYLATHKRLLEKLKCFQNPWSVNSLAQQIGDDCLKNEQYVKEVQQFIKKERDRIFPIIDELGYERSNSEVNFYLLKEKEKEKDTLPFIKFLIELGIIPRHTYNFPSLNGHYLRFAIKTKQENNQLLLALKRWRN